MNKTGSAAKVKLNSFDDLFGDGQPQAGTEQELTELFFPVFMHIMNRRSLLERHYLQLQIYHREV